MAFALHTGRTFTGRDGFRVAYRTYAYLAKVPLLLYIQKSYTCESSFFSIGLCFYGAESLIRLLASTERNRSAPRAALAILVSAHLSPLTASGAPHFHFIMHSGSSLSNE